MINKKALPVGRAFLTYLFIFLVSRRMISFRLGSCLSKLERVKENILKVPQFDDKNHIATLYY